MSEHLSIGEVLAELRGDYPDITISKIRFLESQGLMAPERTPSGYRKFYPDDVERLRWILHQQKDNFLPLKVIRERLASGQEGAAASSKQQRGSDRSSGKRRKTRKQRPAARRSQTAPEVGAPTLPLEDHDDEDPASAVSGSPSSSTSFTRDELARAAGIDGTQLAELEGYGLIAPVAEGERVLFDDEALVVARIAAAFAKHGIEARHLKMYRNFAGREAGVFEQVLLPHLRQRNPEARARAQEQLEELAKLGRSMRAVMLRRSISRALSA